MLRDYLTPSHLVTGSVLAVAAACLVVAPLRVTAQGATLPPGTPQTAPTTVQGTPASVPSIPQQTTLPTQPATPTAPASGFFGLSYTPQSDGMLVASVTPGGPAAQGGVQVGDVVTALNGQQIDAQHDLARMVAAQSPGSTVQLSIKRNGAPQVVTIQMGQTPSTALGSSRSYNPDADYGPPPFSGTYKGRYRAVYLPGTGVTKPQNGRLSLTITPGGAVTGSIHADSGGLNGTVTGTLSSLGHVSLAFTFTVGASGTIEGLLGLTPSGHLTGALTQSFGPSPSGTLTWEAGKEGQSYGV